MRLLSEADVERIMDTEMAVNSAIEAFSAMARGEVQIPLRNEIHRANPAGGALIMPGLVRNEVLGVKLVGNVMDHAVEPPRRRTTGMMLLWDAANLQPRGLIAADTFNNYRTAAGLAAATRHLARPDATTHTVVGAGKISFAAVLHVSFVRPIERIILCSRTPERVARLAERIKRTPALERAVVETGLSVDDASREADIVTTVTTSSTPVFNGGLVADGVHINLGGANRKTQREMDDAAARRARFYLDSAESCNVRAGDILIPLEAGVIGREQIVGEIGDLFLGKIPGRLDRAEITVFKSMGVACQDLFLGSELLHRAEALGVGQEFDHLGAAGASS